MGGVWWDRDPIANPSGIKRKLLQNDLGYVHELCRNLYTIVYNFLYTADCVHISTQSFLERIRWNSESRHLLATGDSSGVNL